MVEESHVHKIKKDAYYVASSDGSELIITTVQLKENDKDKNYAEWAKAMRLALQQFLPKFAKKNNIKIWREWTTTAVTTSYSLPSPSTNSRQICSHCRCHEHVSSSCFYLVGFPDWWPKNGTTAENRGDTAGTEVGLLMAEHLPEVSHDRDRRRCWENVKKMSGSMLVGLAGRNVFDQKQRHKLHRFQDFLSKFKSSTMVKYVDHLEQFKHWSNR
ncbi:hypothetical protein M9H77_06839 [Catharanthus roseus]|uniref:Uncharacterized protein n=1 Tax=Catharanthus roseus TaxID=4058 RepID=A0ACC0BT86_CATRO|nr:hypothetical protein M9H77_06839 [Catharanthus roseus]